LLTDSAQIIVARKSMPANDLRELIGWLKANPDKALAGTAGVGSPQHILGIFFQKSTNTSFGFALIVAALQRWRIWWPSASI
jgi:tripartite-type tricarboxylate transporter receptor subunit TctC